MLNIQNMMWWNGKRSPYRATFRERSWLEKSSPKSYGRDPNVPVLQQKYSREALQMAVEMIPSAFRVADVPRPPQRIRAHSEGIVGRWYSNYWTLHSIRFQCFLANQGLHDDGSSSNRTPEEGGSTATLHTTQKPALKGGEQQHTSAVAVGSVSSSAAAAVALPSEAAAQPNQRPSSIIAWHWGDREQPKTNYEEPHMYVDFEETKALRDYRSRWINIHRSLAGMTKRMKAAEEESRFLGFKRAQEQFWSNRKVFVNRVKSMANQGSITSAKDLPIKTFNLKAHNNNNNNNNNNSNNNKTENSSSAYVCAPGKGTLHHWTPSVYSLIHFYIFMFFFRFSTNIRQQMEKKTNSKHTHTHKKKTKKTTTNKAKAKGRRQEGSSRKADSLYTLVNEEVVPRRVRGPQAEAACSPPASRAVAPSLQPFNGCRRLPLHNQPVTLEGPEIPPASRPEERVAEQLGSTGKEEEEEGGDRQGDDALGLYTSLEEWDPTLHQLLRRETQRQRMGLELIASENFVSLPVLQCLGSTLTNKYAEGRPGARYYGGAEVVDEVERLAESRALQAFGLSPNAWGVNVQPYSGSPANFAVYMALLHPHSAAPSKRCAKGGVVGCTAAHRQAGDLSWKEDGADAKEEEEEEGGVEDSVGGLMGLHLTCGGHLTHGYFTPSKRVSASSLFFRSTPYYTDFDTGRIDYAGMRALARRHRPEVIIAGGSAYPRDWEYAAFREVCDEIGAVLMVDMAHTAGLIAAGEQQSPFTTADVVTTTTHKTLRGPRSGLIFYRRPPLTSASTLHRADHCRLIPRLPQRIHAAVFPGLQGGPHLHQIAAVATQMKAVMAPAWKTYAQQVRRNARRLAAALQARGEVLVTGGTDNHLLLWDLRPHMAGTSSTVDGAVLEQVLEAAHMTVNRNTLAGDVAPHQRPSGVRLGTAALTTRGVTRAEDWETIADFLLRGLAIAQQAGPPPPPPPPLSEGGPRTSSDTTVPRAPPSGNSSKEKGKTSRTAAQRRAAYQQWLRSLPAVAELGRAVTAFAASFPLPGGDTKRGGGAFSTAPPPFFFPFCSRLEKTEP
eukprot:gene4678-3370_t